MDDVADVFRFPNPPKPTPPPNEHLTIFWTLRSPTDRDLTCSAYCVAIGLELRAAYGPDDIVATKLCRDYDADEQIATTADAWRLTLLAKGFRPIAK